MDANHPAIVEALLSVTVHSLAGVGCGCPRPARGREWSDVSGRGQGRREVPSERTLTPDQRRWIKRWTGAPVVPTPGCEQGAGLGKQVVITALIGRPRRPPAVFPQYFKPFARAGLALTGIGVWLSRFSDGESELREGAVRRAPELDANQPRD